MISQYDVKQYLNNDTSPHYYCNEETQRVMKKDSNEDICSIEAYTEFLRKSLHCSFKSVYSCPLDLQNVLRCTECGTVIFSYDDERYDPNLKCPTCSGENTYFEFWTQEDIDADEKKQNTLNFYGEMREWDRKRYEREKRTGLNNYELWKKRITIGKTVYIPKLLVSDYVGKKLKGLHFAIDIINNETHTYKKSNACKIPLSYHYLYIMYLYPIKKKLTKSTK